MDLSKLRKWVVAKQLPQADYLAALSPRLKALAKQFEQVSVVNEMLMLHRLEDPERQLVLVPTELVEMIIRYHHEGPGAGHQGVDSTVARIIKCFYWIGIKRDTRLYIATCPTCEKFKRVTRIHLAGLRPMEVGGRGECIAMDIVGGKESLPQTARANTCILTIIDCFTRFAIAVPLPN